MFIPRILITSAVLAWSASAQRVCNGHSEYCALRYPEVTQIGAHDSPFVGPLPQHNQNLEVPEQLDMGIRFLQGQTRIDIDGQLSMCHTDCFLEDAGPVEDFLSTVKTWMDDHPDEVITLLLTNPDAFSISDFDKAFNGSGITEYAFVPPTSPEFLDMDSWPTFDELISAGTRLITFLDSGADVQTVPYILDEWEYFFETPFGVTDPDFQQCDLDRPADASPDGRMYIVNHFLDIELFSGVLVPHRLAAPRTNSATGDGSIGSQSDLCTSTYDRQPNLILADFVDKGEVMEAQDMLNGF